MTLDHSSSEAAVWAAYDDNAGYDLDGSETQAKTFIRACRILLRRRPKRTARGGRDGHETEFDPTLIQSELSKAEAWLNARQFARSGARRRYASFESFRD